MTGDKWTAVIKCPGDQVAVGRLPVHQRRRPGTGGGGTSMHTPMCVQLRHAPSL